MSVWFSRLLLQAQAFYAPGVALIPAALLRLGDELLGRGGFGEVLAGSLCEGEGRVRPVAIKKLHLSDSDIERQREPLLDEVGIMMSLDHACVLRCFGAVLDPVARDAADRTLGCCIVTELCPLKSLRGALDQLCFGEERGPKERAGEAAIRLASWATSLKVACDVARGMAYLYSKTPPVVSRALPACLSYLFHKQ